MVILKRVEDYNYDYIKHIINESFETYNLYDKLNKDTKIFVKTNCVGPFESKMGITTHPIILKAVLDLLTKFTTNIIVGDNPAVRDINFVLKKCELYDVIKDYNLEVINGKEFTTIHNSNPKVYNTFEVSKEMIDCDILINLPKIKTHSLAYMTCAEKNFFGLIYGLNKSSWHVRASNPLDFGEAINDLYGAFLETMQGKFILHICDGITGLEGEGPSTGGKAKDAKCLIISDDAISADRIALEVCHLDYSRLYINKIANERKYGNGDLDKIEIIGNKLSDFDDIHFLAPKDSLSIVGLKILKHRIFRNLLLEHPTINKNKCVRCGECTRICPPKTMQIKNGKYPKLNSLNCIRCWCCAEVCPQNAIEKTSRPLIGKVVLRQDKKNK